LEQAFLHDVWDVFESPQRAQPTRGLRGQNGPNNAIEFMPAIHGCQPVQKWTEIFADPRPAQVGVRAERMKSAVAALVH
jgi:hypothetical protein